MLFLLADFFEILVKRVLRFLGQKQREGDTNIRGQSEGGLNEFSGAPSVEDVIDSLDKFAERLPTPPGDPCTCLVCEIARPHTVLYERENVSVQASRALDRIYGNWYLIEYLPSNAGA